MIVEWTVPAQICLQEISEYISKDSPDAAHRLIDEIEQSTRDTLTDQPGAGRAGRVDGTREWVAHKNYVVAYRAVGDRVQVLSVMRSARLWPKSL
jgi:toxin ParE1/3/4